MKPVISVSDALADNFQTEKPQDVKIIPASMAANMYVGKFINPAETKPVPYENVRAETSFGKNLVSGLGSSILYIPEKLGGSAKIIGGQALMSIGGYFGENPELVKMGKKWVASGNQILEQSYAEQNAITPEPTKGSWGQTIGNALGTVATTMATGGAAAGLAGLTGRAAARAALGTGMGMTGVLEAGDMAYTRTNKYTEETKDKDFSDYAPEKATKNLGVELLHGTVSGAIEGMFGIGGMSRAIKSDLIKLASRTTLGRAATSISKTTLKSSAEESIEEILQSASQIGFNLLDGTINWENVPEELQNSWKGWVAAALVGGSVGFSGAIYNRSAGIKNIKENLRGFVPDEELENLSSLLYDSGAQTMAEMVTAEVALSTELQNKHGAIIDNMQRAIKRAIDESGAFKDVSEEDLAQYVGDTAKLFADQVLAEAQMRNEPIDTVLKASDIVYEDGGIKLNVRNKAGVSGENTMYQLGGGRGRGYVGHSMSVNMAEAQANNELPASKAASKLGVGVDAIRDVLSPSAWHHASSYYNKVNVYDINPYLELKAGRELSEDVYTPEEIEEYKQNWEMMKTYPKPDKNVKEYYGTAEWIEWEGTRQHPKAIQHKEENIKIQEKGSFYTFYLPDGNIIRKKIGSNGTYVTSEEDLAKKAAFDELSKRSRQRRAEIEKSYQEEYDRYRKENKLDKPDFATFEKVATETNQWGDNIYIDGQKPTSEYKEKGLRRIHRYRDENSKDMMQLQEWDGNEWKVLEEREGEFKRNWHPTIRDSLREYVYGRDEEYRRIYDAHTVEEMEAALNDNTYYQGEEDIKKVSDNRTAVEEQKRYNKEYNQKAKDYFGTTRNLNEAGYILTDGSLLDLSGKRQGAGGGYRALDHLDVAEALENADMYDFINSGNIRYLPESDTIQIADIPTAAQYQTLSSIINKAGGEVTVQLISDAHNDSFSDYYREYENLTLSTLKKDINAFYRGEGVREITQYYQGQIAEKAAFSPTNRDKRTYINDLRAAERGEDTRIRVGELPIVYRELGLSAGMVRTNKDVIFKDTISKHDVPMNVVENLPELYSNPLVIFNSLSTSTNPDSYVAVLDATDKNGRQMIAALSPSKKENGYHLITSFYGRNNIDNMIRKAFEEGKVKYIRDKKISLLAGHDAYLSQANNNILQKSDIVNSFMQNKPQPKGLYDANLNLIKIFESADFSTLPHELAHYWLNNMWNYVRSGNASERYQQRWNVIANWLGITPEQTRIKDPQHERFARGYEQYLLNGNLPTPIIKGAFDDYDRWLKRVYGDMNNLNVRLSDDAVRFFQSMTTGTLPPPKIKPSKKPRSKMTLAEKLREKAGIKADDAQDDEARKFIKKEAAKLEMPENAEARTVITSNITEGEKGRSRVYEREIERNAAELQEAYEDDLTYNKVNLEEQAIRATEFVRNNLNEARQIIDGAKKAPDNILDTAIRIAYEQEMLRIGNQDEYLRALKLHSGLQTLRGQEISAERISSGDITDPKFWINKVIAARTEKAARRIFKSFLARMRVKSSVAAFKDMIKRETDSIAKKVLTESTAERQQRVLKRELERLRREYDTGDGELLFQMPNNAPYNNRNAKLYVREALDNLFGTTVSPEENAKIINEVDKLEKSLDNTKDETGNPTLQSWQMIRKMNDLTESMNPSSNLRIATSIVGRGAMLFSVKSPILNVTSNIENISTEMIVRRIVNKVDGGATYSAVDSNVIKDYLKYTDEVYKVSGYNISTTQDMDATIVTLGEKRITTQGSGGFRWFARGVETGVFKYLMGYPDSRSKDFVFCDAAALEATTIAMNEGLSGEALQKRATYLFKDAARVEPLTEEGMVIREKAINEANIATYTNDTLLSQMALAFREALNNATGDLRLGDQLMPFVKTPANVVSLGLEYSAGLAYAIPNLPTIIKDVKAGKLSIKSRRAIKAAVRNGLGLILAALIAAAFDPDDYTPEYESLTPSERRLAMEKNAVFNSIRIGNRYVSLDYFGPLAFPLTAVLSAKKRKNGQWYEMLYGYGEGMVSQGLKTPGFEELPETIDSIKRMVVAGSVEKTFDNMTNFFIDFIRARTIPSIINDLAKMADDYERETSGGRFDRTINSLPVFRENLPPKYMTLSKTPRETEPFLSTLLFGARLKTPVNNRVVYEIDRLYKSGNRVTITDVTRSGKLSSLNEAKQQQVRKEFASKYYDGVYKLISKSSYRRMDDEQKAAEMNKLRRKIVEDLKDKYL